MSQAKAVQVRKTASSRPPPFCYRCKQVSREDRSNSKEASVWNIAQLCLNTGDVQNPINDSRHAILTQTRP